LNVFPIQNFLYPDSSLDVMGGGGMPGKRVASAE